MVVEIDNIADPRISHYRNMKDASMRMDTESAEGIFVAESPKVIKIALERGYHPVSLLCEHRHISGDAGPIIDSHPDLPVYTGSRETLSAITGYKLTRGVLCVMKRRPLPSIENIMKDAALVCILEGVSDTTNIGAIFRSAVALGVDAVILSSDCCDPLNRRAVRVSMGNVFNIPWTIIDNPVQAARSAGFITAALALRHDDIALDDPCLKQTERLAVVFGTEGDGLCDSTIAECDYVVRIPMFHGVDSLNVAAAAAVTFWELGKKGNAIKKLSQI